jgi:thymidine phosphorylase
MLLGGEALKKFEEMVSYQKGDLKSGFKKAEYIETIKSTDDGYIQNVDALNIGEAVFNLGAGRKSISDNIDRSVGIKIVKKYGDKVSKNEPLLEIHAKNKEDAANAKNKLITSIKIGQNRPYKLKLIYKVIK